MYTPISNQTTFDSNNGADELLTVNNTLSAMRNTGTYDASIVNNDKLPTAKNQAFTVINKGSQTINNTLYTLKANDIIYRNSQNIVTVIQSGENFASKLISYSGTGNTSLTRIYNPGGANIVKIAASEAGYLKILLPAVANTTSNAKVKINFNMFCTITNTPAITNETIDFEIVFNLATGGAYSNFNVTTQAKLDDLDLAVGIGLDNNSKLALWFGKKNITNPTTTMSTIVYQSIEAHISELSITGLANTSLLEWADGWTISLDTTLKKETKKSKKMNDTEQNENYYINNSEFVNISNFLVKVDNFLVANNIKKGVDIVVNNINSSGNLSLDGNISKVKDINSSGNLSLDGNISKVNNITSKIIYSAYNDKISISFPADGSRPLLNGI